MPPPVPRCSGWASSSLISPDRISLPRYGGRVGLHIDLFGACSAFTRVAACTLAQSPIVTASRRLQPFRYLHDCSDCFRLERSAEWDLHPLESAAFARRTPKRGRWQPSAGTLESAQSRCLLLVRPSLLPAKAAWLFVRDASESPLSAQSAQSKLHRSSMSMNLLEPGCVVILLMLNVTLNKLIH